MAAVGLGPSRSAVPTLSKGPDVAGWNAEAAAGPLGTGAVTLVEGSSFCISLPNGDIQPGYPHGLFVQDTRVLSCWSLPRKGNRSSKEARVHLFTRTGR